MTFPVSYALRDFDAQLTGLIFFRCTKLQEFARFFTFSEQLDGSMFCMQSSKIFGTVCLSDDNEDCIKHYIIELSLKVPIIKICE